MRIPDVAGALRNRESHFDREMDGFANLTRVNFFVRTLGPGQCLHDVVFPVVFTEKPDLAYSYEVEEGQALGAEYPEARAGVYHFAYKEIAIGVRYYTGATLILKVTGNDDQALIIHLQFTGTALANPGVPTGGIT